MRHWHEQNNELGFDTKSREMLQASLWPLPRSKCVYLGNADLVLIFPLFTALSSYHVMWNVRTLVCCEAKSSLVQHFESDLQAM